MFRKSTFGGNVHYFCETSIQMQHEQCFVIELEYKGSAFVSFHRTWSTNVGITSA